MQDALSSAPDGAGSVPNQRGLDLTLEVCRLAERILSRNELLAAVDASGWINAAGKLQATLEQAKAAVEAVKGELRHLRGTAVTVGHLTRASYREIAIALGEDAAVVADLYQKAALGCEVAGDPSKLSPRASSPGSSPAFTDDVVRIAGQYLLPGGRLDATKLILELGRMSKRIAPSEWKNLRAMLRAEAESAAAAIEGTNQRKRSTRRGRKKADFATVQKEAALAADWERARDAGTYKGDFARERGLTIGKLDALLDRVAKRNRHSD